jgi:hypothetical protein
MEAAEDLILKLTRGVKPPPVISIAPFPTVGRRLSLCADGKYRRACREIHLLVSQCGLLMINYKIAFR